MKVLIPLFLICCMLFSQICLSDVDVYANQLSVVQNQLRAGQYFLALDDLDSLQKLAQTPQQQAQVHGLFGETYYLMRHYDAATTQFNKALAEAETVDPNTLARWRLIMANLAANRKNPAEAKNNYQLILATSNLIPETKISARLGLAALMKPENRLAELQSIAAQINQLPEISQRAGFNLNLANLAKDLGVDGFKLAYEYYQLARQNAAEQQPRLLAESLDGLAALYEQQNRLAEAQALNTLAIGYATPLDAHDLLIHLEWRQG